MKPALLYNVGIAANAKRSDAAAISAILRNIRVI